jgi:hypothetical protein
VAPAVGGLGGLGIDRGLAQPFVARLFCKRTIGQQVRRFRCANLDHPARLADYSERRLGCGCGVSAANTRPLWPSSCGGRTHQATSCALARAAPAAAGHLRFVKCWVWAHDGSMEHRGVRYTIRAGIERDSWSVAIYPSGVESDAYRFYGTRANAESRARYTIDRWLQEQNIGCWPEAHSQSPKRPLT